MSEQNAHDAKEKKRMIKNNYTGRIQHTCSTFLNAIVSRNRWSNLGLPCLFKISLQQSVHQR